MVKVILTIGGSDTSLVFAELNGVRFSDVSLMQNLLQDYFFNLNASPLTQAKKQV
jgi:hypothetical protein